MRNKLDLGGWMASKEIFIGGVILVVVSLLFYGSAYFKQIEIDEKIDVTIKRQITDDFTFEDYSMKLIY